jgi:8-oxo-dGTP pyrophosphatase MutT (NUDIX family)
MNDPLAPLQAALARDTAGSSDFDLNPNVVLPEGRKLRPAGVLMPVQIVDGVAQVLLTKRASHLKHHPGQIAFPGGKQDDTDANAIAAALREAREEIGLPQEAVRVLGVLPTHETVTSFSVTPVVGLIERDFTIVPEPGEVEEVIRVPLSHVTDTERFFIQARRWRGQRRYYYTVPLGPY